MTAKSKCQCGHIQERHYVGDKSCFDCECEKFTPPAELLTDEIKEITIILFNRDAAIRGTLTWEQTQESIVDTVKYSLDFDEAKTIIEIIYPPAFAAGVENEKERSQKRLEAFWQSRNKQVTELAQEITDLEAEVSNLKSLLDGSLKANKVLKAQQEKDQQEIEGLKHKLHAACPTIASLDSDFSKARKQGAREIIDWLMQLHNPSPRIGDEGHNYWAHQEELQSKLKELEG